jgi:radical SAM superfamily enzyme YgiQ (UPF0313 family)
MIAQRVTSVSELYQDSELYSSPDMFSPPSERLPHVIRFELTKGCGWGRCTYCGGYDGIPHEIKPLQDYRDHVDEVWDRIGNRSELALSLRRIFMGGGNALEVETEMLDEAIQYTARRFGENTGIHTGRISIYGRTPDILKKGKKGLTFLKNGSGRRRDGLDLIYWGVETGSNELLRHVNKGCSKRDVLKASRIVNKTPIKTSVMMMPGLGGSRFNQDHSYDSAVVLGKIKPRFLTFMGINPPLDSKYSRIMESEFEAGENRPLTDKEMANQMVRIIDMMRPFRTKVGCFNCEVDGVGFNPLSFGSFDIYDKYDKNYLADELQRRVDKLDEV